MQCSALLLILVVSIISASKIMEKMEACFETRNADILELKTICYIEFQNFSGTPIDNYMAETQCLFDVYENYGYYNPSRSFRRAENEQNCLCEFCRANPGMYCEEPGEYDRMDTQRVHDDREKCEDLVCNGSGKGKPYRTMCFKQDYEEHLMKTMKP